MRRLPIYFLIDVSESMVGEPIRQVEEGLSTIIQTLKTNPYAVETVHVSIIAFAGQPKTLVPLQELVTFYPPKFPIGSGTSLSHALGHLMMELRRNVKKNTTTRKGDWKPIVFLFTDGVPTDDTTAVFAEWKEKWARAANLVAISFGDEADMRLLGELTRNVLHFKNTGPEAYASFFKWISDSISTSSESVDSNGAGFDLAGVDGETLEKVDLEKVPARRGRVDPNFAVLVGRCTTNKQPYLMKYRKVELPSELPGFTTRMYRMVGSFRVEESYFELSSEGPTAEQKISTDELVGSPTCPCCGNQFAFAMCSCGNLHCISGPSVCTCPWCGTVAQYAAGGSEGFDVNLREG